MKKLRPALATLLVVIGAAAILWLMGRPLTYRGGLIELWGPAGAKQSQMLLDWYSASHVVHGFLFYGLLHLAAKRWKPGQRLFAATIVEAAWEIVENSPVIIDRYREATIALGYRGDTVLNSVSDIAMMIAGFLLAARIPVWASVMIVLVLELVPLAIIRDNLTLNVWMLLSPNDTVLAWQARA
ncbi:DUF2585 family protein [Sphingomonas glaciei]